MDFAEIDRAFKETHVADIKKLADKVDPVTAKQVEQKSELLISKALDVILKGKLGFFETMVEAQTYVWEGFWNSLEAALPPFQKRLSRLKLLGDIEYQDGLTELTPTVLDVGLIQRLASMRPEYLTEYKMDLQKSGFTDRRIDQILAAGKVPLDESQIKSLYMLQYINKDQATNYLSRIGSESDKIGLLINSWEQPLGFDENRHLLLRGYITENDFHKRIKALGVSEQNTGLLRKLVEERPGVSDLVRMAVREVFSPAIAAKYGLFQDYPEEFEKYAQESGLAPEWAKRFWAAHWELPSLGMGYEMFHRRVIDKDDLYELMRAQDVMPYWRDKLEAISYTTLTRVDIRRMFDLGVIDRERVKNSYLDSGYNDADSELMTQFTETYYGEDDRKLTKGEILGSYVAGLMTKQDTIDYLDAYGYSATDASLIVDVYDFKRNDKLLRKSVASIIDQYVEGYFSSTEAQTKLAGLGLVPETIQKQLEAAQIERNSRVATLSIATINKAFKEGIIDIKDYRERLTIMGYNNQDIDILVKLNQE